MDLGGPEFAVNSLRIRLAADNDVASIVEVEKSADEAFLATEHANAPDSPPTDLQAYRRLVASQSAWVAELDGTLVGSAVAERTPDALHVLELSVRKDCQRRGIGQRLMLAVIDAARARGDAAVTLTTFRNVIFNAPFYRTLGFEVIDAPSSRLRAILAAEIAHGWKDRCAMRLAIRDDADGMSRSGRAPGECMT
jgi:GNAT superfamily N-acetyltransferase